MLWAPNSRFGGVGDTRGGYSQYWPGVKYVDILGEHSRTNVFFLFLFFLEGVTDGFDISS